MNDQTSDNSHEVLFIPHGGGPLPLLGHEGHSELIEFLKEIPTRLSRPEAIVVISAHWEEKIPTLTSSPNPALLYDYYGFAPESYQIKYPAPGEPALAAEICDLLNRADIAASTDPDRNFDHGMFVPLKLMYPDADIPCVQISLMRNMSAPAHIKLGETLAKLARKNTLFLGSGYSFHNLNVMLRANPDLPDRYNIDFETWLIETISDEELSEAQRKERLVNWERAPGARYCHPREEHLLPLHVCYGIARTPGETVFNGETLGKKTCAFLWR